MEKKSKYYIDGYNNPIRCSEQIVNVPPTHQNENWVRQMSEGIKDAMRDKSNGNYKFK